MSDATLNLPLGRYKTPVSEPTGTICRLILIPDDEILVAALNELMSLLSNPEIWDDTNGGMTALDTSSLIAKMLQDYFDSVCP